jgi:death-on-curing protein
LEDLLDLHVRSIDRYGGSTGVRDLGLVESALAQPAATAFGDYLHEDLFEMAAAYLL